MAQDEPLLKITDLAVAYAGAKALSGVSLELAPAESIAVLGANGAGKSTLLRAILGRAPVIGGRITFQAEDITRTPTHLLIRRGIALCPEGRQLFPAMSVEDNLLLGAHMASQREARVRLDRIYQRFSLLKERRAEQAGGFSGGEQQLIAIGRALMSGPKLLLLDEPSSGLSPVAIARVRDLLLQVRDGGMSILLVEQNVKLALEMSRRCYVLNRGRLAAAGATAELVDDPTLADAYLGGEAAP